MNRKLSFLKSLAHLSLAIMDRAKNRSKSTALSRMRSVLSDMHEKGALNLFGHIKLKPAL